MRNDNELKQKVFEMKAPCISLEKAVEYVGDNSKYQQMILKVFYAKFVFYCILTVQLPILLPNNHYSLSYYYLGSCLSGIVFTHLSILYSPLKMIKYTLTISLLFLLPLPFISPNHLPSLLFLIAFTFTAFEPLSYIYLTTVSGKRFQNYSLNILNTSWTFSQLLFTLIYQFTQQSHIIILVFIAFPLLFLLIFTHYYIYQSPSYLVSNFQFDQAKQVLRQIQIYNQRPPFNFDLYEEYQTDNDNNKNELKSKNNIKVQVEEFIRSYQQMFKKPKQIMNNLIVIYLWFLRYLFYFGINYSVMNLERRQLNLLMLAVFEIVGILLTLVLQIKIEKKQIIQMSLTLMILFSIIILILESFKNSLKISFTILFKLFLSVFITALQGFTNSNFKTDQFSRGIGLCMTVGKVGLILVPFYFYSFSLLITNPIGLSWIPIIPALVLITLQYQDKPPKEVPIQFHDRFSIIQMTLL